MWKSVLAKLKPPPPPLSDKELAGAQQVLNKSSSPMLMRLRMIAKLSRILGKEVTSSKGRPRLVDTRARPAIQNRKMKLLKKMRTALGKKSKPKKPKKKLKDSKYWRTFAEKKPMKAVCFRLKQEDEEEEQRAIANEPEIIISLCSKFVCNTEELIYDFNSGYYEQKVEEDPLLNLLYIPSKIYLRGGSSKEDEDLEGKRKKDNDFFYQDFKQPPPPPPPVVEPESDSDLEDILDDSRRELEDLYEGQISKDELARIDSQPNPFNFSDRVSQTNRVPLKALSMQTEPPPDNCYVVNVSPSDIYQIYMKDHEENLRKERKRKEEEGGRDRGDRGLPGQKPLDPFILVAPKQTKPKFTGLCYDLGPLRRVVKVIERMVTQNLFDDILQDFKYFEDGSDEYRPMAGSLLPLWRFRHENTRSLIVSDVCWSPVFPDLFAAAYISCELGGDEGPGMMCVYNLKNTVTPERVFHCPCGVLTVQFHPQVAGIIAGGWTDGTIVVYDVFAPKSSSTVTSTIVNGKHLLPVTQVKWQSSEPGEELKFFSVSLDGRVTQWLFHASKLSYTDLLNFKEKPKKSFSNPRVPLEGLVTCIAFCPEDEQVLLLGVDTGAVFQCSTVSSSHSVIRYPAHRAPVREVAWNKYHHKVFLTCSLDWTVKVWLRNNLSPLIVLDVGGAVVGVTWSPYNSCVIVAVTEEFRVNVHDLFERLCYPLCTQSLNQRRKVTGSCVAFSPYYPIILVGGDKGHLVALKLSPNLRRVHKDTRGSDPINQEEIEFGKIERIISVAKR